MYIFYYFLFIFIIVLVIVDFDGDFNVDGKFWIICGGIFFDNGGICSVGWIVIGIVYVMVVFLVI